ncbi:unnamed protein product, partial [Lampetra planeri]
MYYYSNCKLLLLLLETSSVHGADQSGGPSNEDPGPRQSPSTPSPRAPGAARSFCREG